MSKLKTFWCIVHYRHVVGLSFQL